jgi:hypothetical protein
LSVQNHFLHRAQLRPTQSTHLLDRDEIAAADDDVLLVVDDIQAPSTRDNVDFAVPGSATSTVRAARWQQLAWNLADMKFSLQGYGGILPISFPCSWADAFRETPACLP